MKETRPTVSVLKQKWLRNCAFHLHICLEFPAVFRKCLVFQKILHEVKDVETFLPVAT